MRALVDRYTVRRAVLLVAAIGAFALAIAGTAAALKGVADPGVDPALPGGRVGAVSPTGFAWRDGIRSGQLVLSLSASDDPEGWRLSTIDDQGNTFASESRHSDAALVSSLPLGVLAFVAALVALVTTRTNRHLVLPCAWISILCAGVPLALQGGVAFSTAALAAAAAIPGAWIVTRPSVQAVRRILAGLFGAALAVWAVSRLEGWPNYTEIEAYRSGLALAGGAAFLLDRGLAKRASGEGFHVIRPDVAEVVSVALLAALGVVLVAPFEVSPVVVGILIVAGAFGLPALRRRVRPVEDALLADVIAEATADGAEAERARLARELHDVPLQELIAAIRRLEVLPGTETVSDDLRALASHLRDVAIDLRPPVLDDLGLPAALAELADDASRDGITVEAHLIDTTTFDRSARPPADVELALYRIAAEAVSNALRHSGSPTVAIRGRIGRDRVELAVVDTGRGSGKTDRGGVNGKHIGISAMRRRAQAIDADLTIRSTDAGTEVNAVWQN